MNNEEIFKAYLESAKDAFKGMWPSMDDKDVDSYFGACKKFIQNRFEADMDSFARGEFGEEVLRDGCGRSVGWCLGHSYDMPMDD